MTEAVDAVITALGHSPDDGEPFAPPTPTDEVSPDGETSFAVLARAMDLLQRLVERDATLAEIAAAALPALGGWCAIDLLEAGHVIRRAVVTHVDAAKEASARALRLGYPPRPSECCGPARVLRTGRAEVVTDAPATAWIVSARDEGHLALLRTLGAHAYMIFPMTVDGRTVGAITFVAARAGQQFAETAFVLAEGVAQCCGLAVEHTQLRRDMSAGVAFLAELAHDVRTPLHILAGYSELLEQGLAERVEQREAGYLRHIRSASAHLLELMAELFDYANIEAGHARLDAVPGALEPAIETAIASVRQQAEARGVAVGVRGGRRGGDEAGVTKYIGDEDRVRQILITLVSGTVNVTPPGGSVVIDVDGSASNGVGPSGTSRAFVCVRVSSVGTVVDPHALEQIFDPVIDPENQAGPNVEGLGLRLTASRQIARRMGGNVSAQATPTGFAFVLRLPAPQAD